MRITRTCEIRVSSKDLRFCVRERVANTRENHVYQSDSTSHETNTHTQVRGTNTRYARYKHGHGTDIVRGCGCVTISFAPSTAHIPAQTIIVRGGYEIFFA